MKQYRTFSMSRGKEFSNPKVKLPTEVTNIFTRIVQQQKQLISKSENKLMKKGAIVDRTKNLVSSYC